MFCLILGWHLVGAGLEKQPETAEVDEFDQEPRNILVLRGSDCLFVRRTSSRIQRGRGNLARFGSEMIGVAERGSVLLDITAVGHLRIAPRSILLICVGIVGKHLTGDFGEHRLTLYICCSATRQA